MFSSTEARLTQWILPVRIRKDFKKYIPRWRNARLHALFVGCWHGPRIWHYYPLITKEEKETRNLNNVLTETRGTGLHKSS